MFYYFIIIIIKSLYTNQSCIYFISNVAATLWNIIYN